MYKERQKLFERIESIRKRPLITYVTSIRPNMSAQMVRDAVMQIILQVDAIPADQKEIDILIISNGGDPITSLRINNLLRERFDKISVLVPYVAFSAATVLALGADEIVMHPYSNLGPVDPQLTVAHSNEKGIQEHLQFSSEDIRNYVTFLKEDIGISDQQHLVSAVQPLLKDVGALPIGRAKRGQQLSLSLSEKMLSTHIKDSNKAKSIAQLLNTSYYDHGYAVGRTEAKELELPIVYPPKELEQLLWDVWRDYSDEMKCDDPFDVVSEVMNDKDAQQKISQVPVVDLPVNTPPDVAAQIIIQYAQNTPVTTRSSLKKKVLIASIESTKFSKAVYNNIDILYWRKPDMNLGVNCTISGTGWINYENEEGYV